MDPTVFSKYSSSEINFILYSAMKYQAKIRKNHISDRKRSSLLFILKGEYLYRYGNEHFIAADNSLVVIPKGASYSYKILSTQTECMQIEFDILQKQTPIAIAKHPFAVNPHFDISQSRIFEKIIDLYTYKPSGYTFSAAACLFKLFAALIQNEAQSDPKSQSKITPAVVYLSQHYCEKVEISRLAELCFMSESQLRRLFHAQFGISPLQYKIQLQIEAACNLLESGHCQISQIADMLGFHSVYEFSAAFKRKTGQSPRTYANARSG